MKRSFKLFCGVCLAIGLSIAVLSCVSITSETIATGEIYKVFKPHSDNYDTSIPIEEHSFLISNGYGAFLIQSINHDGATHREGVKHHRNRYTPLRGTEVVILKPGTYSLDLWFVDVVEGKEVRANKKLKHTFEPGQYYFFDAEVIGNTDINPVWSGYVGASTGWMAQVDFRIDNLENLDEVRIYKFSSRFNYVKIPTASLIQGINIALNRDIK